MKPPFHAALGMFRHHMGYSLSESLDDHRHPFAISVHQVRLHVSQKKQRTEGHSPKACLHRGSCIVVIGAQVSAGLLLQRTCLFETLIPSISCCIELVTSFPRPERLTLLFLTLFTRTYTSAGCTNQQQWCDGLSPHDRITYIAQALQFFCRVSCRGGTGYAPLDAASDSKSRETAAPVSNPFERKRCTLH
jgi:hypothetical protein